MANRSETHDNLASHPVSSLAEQPDRSVRNVVNPALPLQRDRFGDRVLHVLRRQAIHALRPDNGPLIN